jgi:hypothetical protein
MTPATKTGVEKFVLLRRDEKEVSGFVAQGNDISPRLAEVQSNAKL